MSNLAKLAYIAVSSRNPSALHKLLSECLQLDYLSLDTPDGSIDAYGVGDTALAVFPVGSTFLSKDKPGVDHLAFSTSNAKDAASLFINDAKHSSGINGAQQIQVPEGLTQGVFSRFTPITDLRGNSTEFVERMDHIGIASNSNIIAESIFAGKLGLTVESRQTDMEVKVSMESFTSDKYGVIYKTRPPKTMGGLRVSFITIGDTELEFLENFNDQHHAEVTHGTPGNTKQDQGAITKYVEKYGPGLHHLAFKTTDINKTLKHVEKHDFRLIDTIGREGSRRSLIGFIHPASTGGVLIHFVEREEIKNA